MTTRIPATEFAAGYNGLLAAIPDVGEDADFDCRHEPNSPLVLGHGRIVIDPEICNGRPTIRGKRIAVQTVLEYLGAGESEADILAEYPMLETDDIHACLTFAARLMGVHFDLVKAAP